jgi:Zn-dependent protease
MKLLDDVAVWLFFERGDRKTYIVGSITADRYLTVPAAKLPAIRAFMERLDGTRTLGQVREELVREHGLKVDVEALHRKFDSAGLLADGSGPAQGDIERMSATLLRLPIGSLLEFLRGVSPLVPLLAGTGLAAIAAALTMFALDPASRSVMAKAAGDQSLWKAAWLALGIMLLSGFLHELSHCLVAARWGIRKATFRVHLYLGVMPIIALKLAGLYTLPPKGRAAVWSAGVFANLTIVAGALLGLRFVWPGSAMLQVTVAINWFMAILNILPLAPTDGYFLLATWTNDQNVRMRAWEWLRRPFRPGRQRPSWFVLAYLVSTVWLLLSTVWYHASRILSARVATWQPVLSVLMLAMMVVALWRRFRHTEE